MEGRSRSQSSVQCALAGAPGSRSAAALHKEQEQYKAHPVRRYSRPWYMLWKVSLVTSGRAPAGEQRQRRMQIISVIGELQSWL